MTLHRVCFLLLPVYSFPLLCRKKEYVTMRCLELEKQIATTMSRVKNNEVPQIVTK